VLVIVDVESHDALDEILLTLPIMVEMGQFVDIKVTALRRYEDFAGTVNRLLAAEPGGEA
jgi:muconolactone D-isomerase